MQAAERPSPEPALKRVPLHDLHVARGGKIVPFAGYEMPVQYAAGVLKEHLHTRASAGLFDVSHMGQIVLRPKSGKVEDAGFEKADDAGWKWEETDHFVRIFYHTDRKLQATVSVAQQDEFVFSHASLTTRTLDAFADQLGNKPWLMRDDPCSADASVWAMRTGLLCPLFDTPLRDAAERHANLVSYRDRGLARWYPELSMSAL